MCLASYIICTQPKTLIGTTPRYVNGISLRVSHGSQRIWLVSVSIVSEKYDNHNDERVMHTGNLDGLMFQLSPKVITVHGFLDQFLR